MERYKLEWEPIICMALDQYRKIPRKKQRVELDYFIKEILVRSSDK